MARLAWQKSLPEKGYISNLSVSHGTLAVVSPFEGPSNQLYVYDVGTGAELPGLFRGEITYSVAVVGNNLLLLVQGSGVAVSIVSVKDKFRYEFKWDSLPPSFDEEIFIGKIAVIPEQNRALIAGASDRDDTEGFLILAEWGRGIDQGRLFTIYKGIDEAPHDLTIVDDRVYIAKGRGGSIEVFDFSKQSHIGELTVPNNTSIFKPMRVVAFDSYIVAASYNQLFWWEGTTLIAHEDICGSHDTINGLAAIPREGIICALTHSSQLLLKPSPEAAAEEIKIIPPPPPQLEIRSPCWVISDTQAADRRIYVTGYFNGNIWAIEL